MIRLNNDMFLIHDLAMEFARPSALAWDNFPNDDFDDLGPYRQLSGSVGFYAFEATVKLGVFYDRSVYPGTFAIRFTQIYVEFQISQEEEKHLVRVFHQLLNAQIQRDLDNSNEDSLWVRPPWGYACDSI